MAQSKSQRKAERREAAWKERARRELLDALPRSSTCYWMIHRPLPKSNRFRLMTFHTAKASKIVRLTWQVSMVCGWKESDLLSDRIKVCGHVTGSRLNGRLLGIGEWAVRQIAQTLYGDPEALISESL